MRKRMRIGLAAALAILVLAAALLSAWFYQQAAKSLPAYSGEITLRGVTGPALVRFDEHAIPTIQAATLNDAFLIQGYITAQERLWQMDITRRAATGTLSEILGRPALESDRFFRKLLLASLSARVVGQLSAENRSYLESYAEGVNQYLENHRESLPPEFRLLAYSPDPWRPEDAVLVGKMMHWRLTRTYATDLMKEELIKKLGSAAEDLFPEKSPQDLYLFATPPSMIAVPAAEPTVPARDNENAMSLRSWHSPDEIFFPGAESNPLLRFEGAYGSNNWVVSGARSKSGKPIIANDPHLWHGIPSVWHIVQLELPDLKLAGVAFPGAPGIVLGHNDQVAWAVTNVEADVQDVYHIEFTGESENSYLVDGETLEAQKTVETLNIKDAAPEMMEVLVTRFGPVLERQGQQGIALRWTGLEESTELLTFMHLMKAANWDDFRAALSEFPGPPQNFLFADRAGNIGYAVGGRFPVRGNWDGSKPVSGNTKEFEWKGWVPVEELPRVFNPPSGWLATANNRMVDDQYPHVLAHNWAPPYRFSRIRSLIETKRQLRVEEIFQIQGDSFSFPDVMVARMLVQTLERARQRTPDEEWALQELSSWDGHMRRTSVAASLAWTARTVLQELLLRSRLGDALWAKYRWSQSVVVALGVLQRQDSAWLPARSVRTSLDSEQDYVGKTISSFEDLHRYALSTAIASLRRRYDSSNVDNWRWGKVNGMRFEHPLGKFWPLNSLLNSQFLEQEGSSNSVSASTASAGPSMRLVVDMSDTTTTYIHITTGQSGHFLNQHYLDQIPLWNSVKMITLSHKDEALQSSSGILKISPATSSTPAP
jgi:penicillin G amidase